MFGYERMNEMQLSHLQFLANVGKQKPRTLANRSVSCPFCDRQSLTGILDEEGPIILLKNKYPVLEGAFQTVLIETDECDSELSVYPKEHLYRLIRFGVKHWLDMEKSGGFTSVVFFKNHGPLSGGTIAHPHMQIVGLDQIDYRLAVYADYFEGICIENGETVELNLSTKPRIGFYEWNVVLGDLDHIDRMADYIQIVTHYILNHFRTNSYNLFFYHLNEKIICKVVPRFATSPYFVGYSIPQVGNNLNEIIEDMRKKYFEIQSE